MKKIRIFILTSLVLLLSSDVFGVTNSDVFNSPATSSVLTQFDVTFGNYDFIKPNFDFLKNTCIPEKISDKDTATDDFYKPYTFDDYIIYKRNYYTYLWRNGKEEKISKIPYKSKLIEFNDYNVIYKYSSDFYLYDVKNKSVTKLILPDSKNISWLYYDNNQILFYNDVKNTYYLLADSLIREISKCSSYCSASMDNGKIAYSNEPNKSSQIFYWNETSIIQLTMGDDENIFPDIYNNQITWVNRAPNTYDNSGNIFFWDGSKIIQITDNNERIYLPKLYNGKIVWNANKENATQIFFWNGNEIIQLTDGNSGKYNVDYHKGRIVWEDNGIYTCTIEALMPNPKGLQTFQYESVNSPIFNTNPSIAKPFATGNISLGNLDLQVGLYSFESPVDIYLAISFDGIKDKIFFINSSNKITENIEAWKLNYTYKVENTSLFGKIPVAGLPNGTYILYLLAVPAGAVNMDNGYLWITNFTVAH